MSLTYCQGPKCHTYDTKDRKKGPKDNKRNETRRRSSFYYLDGHACSMNCERDWFNKFGSRALDHFGRVHEPITLTEDNAWYKWSSYNGYDNTPRYNRFFVNDLTDQRIPITEQQYEDENLVRP